MEIKFLTLLTRPSGVFIVWKTYHDKNRPSVSLLHLRLQSMPLASQKADLQTGSVMYKQTQGPTPTNMQGGN